MLLYVCHCLTIYLVIICHTMLYILSMKKTSFISFRTTKENEDFLKDIAEFDERSLSSTISKMIGYFRRQWDHKQTARELNK